MACRDIKRGEDSAREVSKESQNRGVQFMALDLSDLTSIENFVKEFKRKFKKLNILINNAGVMLIPQKKLT